MEGIYKALHGNQLLELRGVFFDLSKVFDRVWHEGLMYNLKHLEICGKCYAVIHSFFRGRCQIVVLKEQSSN